MLYAIWVVMAAMLWAKPVPINPYNFKDKRWGTLKVALAGPSVNFLIAIFFSLLVRFTNLPQQFSEFLAVVAFYNFLWGLFNLLPIPPLDGSKIVMSFLPREAQIKLARLESYGFFILVILLFTGLLNPVIAFLQDLIYGMIAVLFGFFR